MKRKIIAFVGATVLTVASLFVWATQGGTNSSQATLLDAFCDQCGLPTNANLRNLVQSAVTLSDAQTITGAKTFSGATTFSNTTTGVPYPLAKGGLPLIGLATSTMTAGGVVTVGTALPLAYPAAYCYLPANAIATSAAAGWRYCTFSTTTSGVIFQDAYTSGVPTIPASPTPATTASNFTGDTGEEFANTITVPANAMGTTGSLRVGLASQETNNANAKTIKVRWSGNAGTPFFSINAASTVFTGMTGLISNTGATNANLSAPVGSAGNFNTLSAIGIIDTTSATTLVFSIQRATATDNVVILPPTVELMS